MYLPPLLLAIFVKMLSINVPYFVVLLTLSFKQDFKPYYEKISVTGFCSSIKWELKSPAKIIYVYPVFSNSSNSIKHLSELNFGDRHTDAISKSLIRMLILTFGDSHLLQAFDIHLLPVQNPKYFCWWNKYFH